MSGKQSTHASRLRLMSKSVTVHNDAMRAVNAVLKRTQYHHYEGGYEAVVQGLRGPKKLVLKAEELQRLEAAVVREIERLTNLRSAIQVERSLVDVAKGNGEHAQAARKALGIKEDKA